MLQLSAVLLEVGLVIIDQAIGGGVMGGDISFSVELLLNALCQLLAEFDACSRE